jgi:sugar/nucleoside kinase (ribokinase family)
MSGVLVVGEALVDVVVRSDGTVSEHPGGSPLNVAIALARLERETHLLTRLDQDERGRSVLHHLGSSGVQLVEGSVLPVATATAAATLAPTARRPTSSICTGNSARLFCRPRRSRSHPVDAAVLEPWGRR